jgi:hypothetical protein
VQTHAQGIVAKEQRFSIKIMDDRVNQYRARYPGLGYCRFLRNVPQCIQTMHGFAADNSFRYYQRLGEKIHGLSYSLLFTDPKNFYEVKK